MNVIMLTDAGLSLETLLGYGTSVLTWFLTSFGSILKFFMDNPGLLIWFFVSLAGVGLVFFKKLV